MRRHLAISAVPLAVAVLGLGLLAVGCGGCGKKSSADPESYQEIGQTFDESEPAPEERKPIEGVDLSALSEAERNRFERLVDSLASPCGEAHSLRTSKNEDDDCVKARFAVEYLVALLEDGFTNKEVRELYDLRYEEDPKRRGFKLDGVPHQGPEDAQVVLVEFYDYGCPSCKRFKPVIEKALEEFPRDAVVYYKQFPLSSHPNSDEAAQAALAAQAQGKFQEMHDLLFANPYKHSKEHLLDHARSLDLDMDKFEKDFEEASSRVQADKQEGVDAGVKGTPTLYINGRMYDGLDAPKYLKLWIREALAVSD